MIATDTRIERRPLESLCHANHGWLHARHHFSSPATMIPTG